MDRLLSRHIWEGQHLGVWTTRALNTVHGTGNRSINRPVPPQLTRVRRGVYVSDDVDPSLRTAATHGVTISCLPACKIHGLWVPRFTGHHVLIPRHISPKNTIFDDSCRMYTPTFYAHVAYLTDALTHVTRRHSAEVAFIVVESALNKGLISLATAQEILQQGPTKTARLLSFLDATSQSGSETRVRLFFQRRRIKVQSQVPIPSVGRVDLLIGNSVIVEVDSRAHHTSPQDYEKDRQRDLASIRAGYRTIRLSFSQIWTNWEDTQSFLLGFIRSRRHLSATTPLRNA